MVLIFIRYRVLRLTRAWKMRKTEQLLDDIRNTVIGAGHFETFFISLLRFVLPPGQVIDQTMQTEIREQLRKNLHKKKDYFYRILDRFSGDKPESLPEVQFDYARDWERKFITTPFKKEINQIYENLRAELVERTERLLI